MRRLDATVPRPEERLRTSGNAGRRPGPRLRLRAGQRRAAALGLAAVVSTAVIGGGVWLTASGRAEAAAATAVATLLDASARAGLGVHDIQIEGTRRTPRDDVLAALGVNLGAPVLGVDIAAARRRVEDLPWVESARVERRLPAVVRVAVQERDPVALWQRDGRHVLVDAAGAPIAADAGAFGHLPVVVGADAPAHAAGLLAALAAEPDLLARVKAAVRVGGRRWNLTLDDLAAGPQVRLPEEGLAAAWRRLAAIERHQAVLTPQMAVVDLRLPDRMVLRRRDGARLSGPGA